jgi:hypothetical protein
VEGVTPAAFYTLNVSTMQMIRILDSDFDEAGDPIVRFQTKDPQEAYEFLLLNGISPSKIEISVTRPAGE